MIVSVRLHKRGSEQIPELVSSVSKKYSQSVENTNNQAAGTFSFESLKEVKINTNDDVMTLIKIIQIYSAQLNV